MAERLQKILSQWGIASRRQAEKMILAGRVRLNGMVVQLGQTAEPEHDRIEVDGKLIQSNNRPTLVYLLLYKPTGVVSTCHDPQKRTTVLDLLPKELRQGQGLHPVGRLDAESTGALLLTNDGEMTLRLTHPRYHLPKTYYVWVEGNPPEEVLKIWRQGVVLAGEKTLPAQVRVLSRDGKGAAVVPGLQHQALTALKSELAGNTQISDNLHLTRTKTTLLEVVLREGRNRQIRRVAQQLGYPVVHLHRTAIGPICLERQGQLMRPGSYRPLEDFEIYFLQNQLNLTSVKVAADIKEQGV